MSVEIRPARPEELTDYLRVVKYVFAVPPDDPNAQPDLEWRLDPEHTVCAVVDGQIVSTYGAYAFEVRLNGTRVPMAGVTNVGTLPGYRRQGHIRELVLRGISDARDRGQSCTMLWASYAAIYQRFGYGLASKWVGYRWDPRYGALTGPRATGRTEVVAPSEGRAIAEELHPRFAEPRNLMIERSGEFWKRLFEPHPPTPPPQHMGVYRNAQGEARGYVLFNVREHEDWEPGPNQYATVRDFAWLDIDAYRGLWEFLAGHDLFREIDMERVPEDDPAMLLLLEPRTLHRRTGDAIWLRVADAELALRQRAYGAAGTLTLRVVDEHFDWNDATFRIEAGEASEVSRVGGEAALTVPVARLAQLLSGYASASELARAGLIEVNEPSVLATADAMFATAYRPYCQDGF